MSNVDLIYNPLYENIKLMQTFLVATCLEKLWHF